MRGEGWSGDLLIADYEDLENVSAADIHFKRFEHQEVAQEETLLFPCADGSLKRFDLLHPRRVEMPARRNPEQGENEEEDTLFPGETGEYFWSMSCHFKYRHHEVPGVSLVRTFSNA